ncbi:MAG TPA: O-antigen ligase family protein, partial [Polyangiaceae bacterium]|nr:O-antigen ligase family protein [Polyangiaceae bacterium]
ALIWARAQLKQATLGKLPWLCFAVMVLVDMGRAWTNMDAIFVGGRVIGPILAHTALTFIMEDFLLVFVPFYLGAALYRDRDALRDFIRIFATAGVLYAPLVMLELRFSPQLHAWVYGYHQHSWLQVMRDGAFRPMVFMHHGLALALFMATCGVLAFGMAKGKEKLLKVNALPIAIFLTVLVALSHSLGALVFVAALGPLVWLTPPKLQLRVAALIAGLVMFYPMLRAYDWFPTNKLLELANSISSDRAGSLAFRFNNEDITLRRALERPIFGWGGFDRIFIYDAESGDEVSTLDGAWLITYCSSGLLGFVSRYGLLTWPVWLAFKRIRRVPIKTDQALVAALGVATAMVALDLLPNGMFTYFPHLFAGVLLGAVRQLTRRDAAAPVRGSSERPRARQPQPANV